MTPRRTGQSVLQLRFRTFIVRRGRLASPQRYGHWHKRTFQDARCMFAFGSNATPWRAITTLACHRPIRSDCLPRRGARVLPESAGQKLVAASQRPPRDPRPAASLPHPRFRAAYSAARYAASAAMSSSVIAFIRSDMPGLLPRAPLRKSSIVLSRYAWSWPARRGCVPSPLNPS
jgi:hypothetical protein